MKSWFSEVVSDFWSDTFWAWPFAKSQKITQPSEQIFQFLLSGDSVGCHGNNIRRPESVKRFCVKFFHFPEHSDMRCLEEFTSEHLLHISCHNFLFQMWLTDLGESVNTLYFGRRRGQGLMLKGVSPSETWCSFAVVHSVATCRYSENPQIWVYHKV